MKSTIASARSTSPSARTASTWSPRKRYPTVSRMPVASSAAVAAVKCRSAAPASPVAWAMWPRIAWVAWVNLPSSGRPSSSQPGPSVSRAPIEPAAEAVDVRPESERVGERHRRAAEPGELDRLVGAGVGREIVAAPRVDLRDHALQETEVALRALLASPLQAHRERGPGSIEIVMGERPDHRDDAPPRSGSSLCGQDRGLPARTWPRRDHGPAGAGASIVRSSASAHDQSSPSSSKRAAAAAEWREACPMSTAS